MKIICPQCQTAYDIPAAKIGGTGRKVKCASCNHIWQVTPADAVKDAKPAEPDLKPKDTADTYFEEDFAAEAKRENARHEAFSEDDLVGTPRKTTADSGKTESDDSDIWSSEKNSTNSRDSNTSEPPESDRQNEPESQQNQPDQRARKKRRSSRKSSVISAKRLLGYGLLAASIALCFSVVRYRENIVRTFPDLAGLYQLAGMTVNLRGLVFRDLRTFREVENGAVVLVVEGSVENITRSETYIPAIKLALRSQDTQEIHSWVVEPREDRLAPGTTTRFRARLSNPPERAADIQLRFVERQKKRASIR